MNRDIKFQFGIQYKLTSAGDINKKFELILNWLKENNLARHYYFNYQQYDFHIKLEDFDIRFHGEGDYITLNLYKEDTIYGSTYTILNKSMENIESVVKTQYPFFAELMDRSKSRNLFTHFYYERSDEPIWKLVI